MAPNPTLSVHRSPAQAGPPPLMPERQQTDLDLRPIIERLRARWYVIVATLVVFMLAAWIFVKASPNIFAVETTMLIGDRSTGSKNTEELLELLEARDRGVKVEDEIGMIKSEQMVRRTMERLDFAVSYFEVEDNLFNKFRELQVRERYRDFPFQVIINPAANQMTGVRIYIRLIPPALYEMRIQGEDVKVYNLQTRELIHRIPEVDITRQWPVNKPYQDEYLNFKVILNKDHAYTPSSKYFIVVNDLSALTGQYLRKLEAKPIQRESRIINITSEGPIPEKEVNFLNTLVDVLIETDLEAKNTTGRRALEFIDSQLTTVGDSLRRAETALTQFRSTNKVLNINTATNSIYVKLDNLEQERARLQNQLRYYQSVQANLSAEQQFTNIASPGTLGIDNPILNSLLMELTSYNRQLAGLDVTVRGDAPNVRTIKAKIENARLALVENLAQNINQVRSSLAEVNSRIQDVSGNIYQLPESERRLQDLQGKTEFNARTYNFMLEKRAQAAIALAANTPDKRRIDLARMSGTGPKYPKSKQIYMIAFLLGIVLPAGLIIALDKLNDTIRSKEELEGLSPIPFLGTITQAPGKSKLPVVDRPLSAVTESFRSLRVNLQYLAAGMDKKVIGVTSSISGEGKTFCSANLAAELAQSGRRVLLIEADLRRPTLSLYFEGAAAEGGGLASFLIRRTSLDEAVRPTHVPGLDVMLSGAIPPNPIELLSQPLMAELIAQARQAYDYIVIDVPPVGFVSEYYVLLGHLDASLFVTRHRYTSRGLLSQINNLYREGKVEHLYLVLNGLDYYRKYEYRNKGHRYYRGA